MNPQLKVARTAVLTAVTLLGCSCAHFAKPRTVPPSLETISLQAVWNEASVARNPPQAGVAAPPEGRDPTAPATVLFGVVTSLDDLAEDRGEERTGKHRRRHAARAGDAVARALAQYGTSADVTVVLRSLADAARELEGVDKPYVDDAHDPFERLSIELAQVARSISVDLIDLAVTGAARPEVVESARSSVARGDLSIEGGNYVAAIGHYGGASNFASNGLAFDIDVFEQNLRNALDGNTVGYAYAIVRDGILYSHSEGHGGRARRAADPPPTDQSPFKKMYTASISKTVSAVALLRALDQAGLSVDDEIAEHLPTTWTRGPGVNQLTFRHLLTHTSGLDPNNLSAGTADGQSLETLEQIIETGSPGGFLLFTNIDYTNANFSLMRILIPRIAYSDAVSEYTAVLPEDVSYGLLYLIYVLNEVFHPIGVSGARLTDGAVASERTRYYSFSSPNLTSVGGGDWTLASGATGWYLSAIDLARLLAFMRYTDTIIDTGKRQQMDSGFLGWLNPIKYGGLVDGDFGVYRAHGGDSRSDSNPGMTGCAMNFPIRLQATLLINSRGNNITGHACTVLRDAYDGAWVGN